MKVIFRISGIILFLLVVIIIIIFSLNTQNTLSNIQPIISFFSVICGAIWAISGIILNWSTLVQNAEKAKERYQSFKEKSFIHIIKPEKYINRKVEIKHILESVRLNFITNVYGFKGSGKSETLMMICDIINGFHKKIVKQRILKEYLDFKKKRDLCFYIDLSEVAGVQDMILQLSISVLGCDISDISQLAKVVKKKLGKKKVIIILDNLNSKQAGSKIIEKISVYLRIRQQDRFIIGSVERLFDISNETKYLQINPLDETGIREYLDSKYTYPLDLDIDKIKSKTHGLPLFLNLLIVELENRDEKNLDHSVETFLTNYILEKLPNEARKLLAFLSFFNLTSTTIEVITLINFPITDIDVNIEILKKYSTIIELSSYKKRSIKVHDLIRDIVIKTSKEDQYEINKTLYEYYKLKKDYHRATLHWFLTGKDAHEEKNAIDFIKREIENSNYPYLVSVWDIYNRNREFTFSLDNNHELQQLILYSYVQALLGEGDYKSAEVLVNSSQFGRSFLPDIRNIKNEMELEFHFALVDLDHLLNRYYEALEVLDILLSVSVNKNFKKKETECIWLKAHLMGHIGSDLDNSILLYNNCIEKAKFHNYQKYYLKSKNGLFAIKAAKNLFDDNYENQLDEALNEASKVDGTASIIASLLRNKARYYRRNNRFEEAINLVDESLNIARENRLRTVFNCHLSYGDILRFKGDYRESITYYKKVLKFTNENGDVHLESSAIGGLIISEIGLNDPIYHKDWNNAMESILSYQEIAEKHSLEVTKYRFEIIQSFINDKIGANKSENNDYFSKKASSMGLLYEYDLAESLTLENLSKMEMHIH